MAGPLPESDGPNRVGTAIVGFDMTLRTSSGWRTPIPRSPDSASEPDRDHGNFREIQLVGERDTTVILLLTDVVPELVGAAIAAGAGEVVIAPQFHAPSNSWFTHLRDPDGSNVQPGERRAPSEG